MTLPFQKLQINDPGLPPVPPGATIPMVIGVSSSGPTNELTLYNDPSLIVGEGPGPELVAELLRRAGGPVGFIRCATNSAGSSSAVTQTGGGPAMTLTGTPFDSYDLVVRVTKAGAIGTSEFVYALDGSSFSQPITTAATFAVPRSGLTLNFAAGSYVVDTTYEATCTEPRPNAAGVVSAIEVFKGVTTPWRFVAIAGKLADAAAAVALGVAVDGALNALYLSFKPKAAIIDAGSNSAVGAVVSAWANTLLLRVCPVYGHVDTVAARSFVGWSTVQRPLVNSVAIRAASVLVSTDLARVASGPLPDVLGIDHDEYATPALDDAGISTARTWPNKPGFYIGNARIKSGPLSDIQFFQFRTVMDLACEIVTNVQPIMIKASLRTVAGGALDPRDAKTYEQAVLSALYDALMRPSNQEGEPGHISAVSYQIDRTNNIRNSGIRTRVGIQPLSYPDMIYTEIGFTVL